MDLIQAIVLGIIQGATEFLPISSTAHLRIVPALLGWSDPGAGFTAVIQLGTLLAVLLYFRKDIASIFMGWARSIASRDYSSVEARMGWGILWGTLPIIVLGKLLENLIEGELRSLIVMGAMLVVMGLLMWFAERQAKGQRGFEDLTAKDGIAVGFWQAVALIPGASRSGSTITGALFQKLDRATAARFSFLLSTPSVLAAGLYSCYKHRTDLLGQGVAWTLIAAAVAFVVGYASIAWLIGVLQKRGTLPFVLYRVVVGLAIIGLVLGGVLPNKEEIGKAGHTRVSTSPF